MTTQALPSSSSWSNVGPLVVNPGASVPNVYRSPFEKVSEDSGSTTYLDRNGLAYSGEEAYFSIGPSADYNGTDNPASLMLGELSRTFSFLLGSPDQYNTVAFYRNGSFVESFDGGPFSPNAFEASYLTFTAGNTEYFDEVRFRSTTNAMEFSNIEVGAVPIPAAGILLIGALGGLGFAGRRRRKVT